MIVRKLPRVLTAAFSDVFPFARLVLPGSQERIRPTISQIWDNLIDLPARSSSKLSAFFKVSIAIVFYLDRSERNGLRE